jgi:S-adenosylmethionine:tRNA ribosyltransferase-isomerase
VKTADFDYELPPASIAQTPVEPRDASRLLVASDSSDRLFSDLPQLLESGDLLVVNRTKVRAARLRGTKAASGGALELLLTKRLDATRWEALARPSRRLRPGIQVTFGPIAGEILTSPAAGVVEVALRTAGGDIEDLLPAVGEIPLPPYIHTELADPTRYQTMFAKTVGSAAAPTAALHFTPRLVERLLESGVEFAEVELEVGLDTFRPIAAGNVADHVMHREAWVVPEATVAAIAATRRRGSRVVAVGTTVVRTLESAAGADGGVMAGEGETELFIAPGYRLRAVDALITNFHAPRTTLLVMIAALLGPRWRDLYSHAVAEGYRFLSFGDAMLIDDPGRAS